MDGMAVTYEGALGMNPGMKEAFAAISRLIFLAGICHGAALAYPEESCVVS